MDKIHITMTHVFANIGSIISKLSTGPAACLVVEIGSNLRYAIVQPYNFYFINDCKTIVHLLTYSRVPKNYSFNAIEILDSDEVPNGWRYTTSDTTMNDINKYFSENRYHKFILFTEVQSYTIEQLLNRILELGIFTIK